MNTTQVMIEVGRLHLENLELRARLEEALETIRRLSADEQAVAPAEDQEGSQPAETE